MPSDVGGLKDGVGTESEPVARGVSGRRLGRKVWTDGAGCVVPGANGSGVRVGGVGGCCIERVAT